MLDRIKKKVHILTHEHGVYVGGVESALQKLALTSPNNVLVYSYDWYKFIHKLFCNTIILH